MRHRHTKLIAYGKTGSDKHLRDALGVLLMHWTLSTWILSLGG
jgi:hypothetical protein